MELTTEDVMLVTGATGLVGSHVAERAREQGLKVRTIVRSTSDTTLLKQWGVELFEGDLSDRETVRRAVAGATVIVHCAAKVGDWGPVAAYREVNVDALEHLLNCAEQGGTLKRFVHVSSLGVYQARDHYGTDESEAPNASGIDGYTLTKVEAENLVREHHRSQGLPAVVLRPGFIYGPRDRTVLPRLLERVKSGVFAFLGSPEKLMNNTYVKNLVDAIWLAIEKDDVVGEVFNITDGELVTKKKFVGTAAELAEYPVPTKVVPLGVAKTLAKVLEGTWRLLGKKEAPILSGARIKFLGLNLDYCIDKARRQLGYSPKYTFDEGMAATINWFREQKML